MRRFLLSALAAFGVFTFATSRVALAQKASASSGGQAAARVNGRPIPLEEVKKVAQEIAEQGQTRIDSTVWNSALEQLITAELLLQAAKSQGVAVSEKEIDQELQEIQAFGKDHPLVEWLRKTEPNRAREEIRRSLLIEKFLDKRIKVEISPAQVRQYYEEHAERFERPPMVRASHILIRVQGNDRESARKRAEELRERVMKGEDFSELAKRYSQDPYTAAKGGDLDFFPERPTPVAQAAFQLEVGQVSDIVESPYGFHIIKVTARRPAGRASLEEVSDEIRSLLEEDRREEAEEALVEELRQKARIEILVANPPASNAPTPEKK